MNASNLIEQLLPLVEQRFRAQSADHDWFHIHRVFELATYIQQKEGGDLEIVQAGALLHDISDHKLNGGILNANGAMAEQILSLLNAPEKLIVEVVKLVDAVSFKGAKIADENGSIELSIVRDADRLDAMGAMGIARAFHYGGSKNRAFYLPDSPPKLHDSFVEYANDKSHTINHFHEKLLLLNDRLVTPTAKRIGNQRHHLMEQFVVAFMNEWNVSVDN